MSASKAEAQNPGHREQGGDIEDSASQHRGPGLGLGLGLGRGWGRHFEMAEAASPDEETEAAETE